MNLGPYLRVRVAVSVLATWFMDPFRPWSNSQLSLSLMLVSLRALQQARKISFIILVLKW